MDTVAFIPVRGGSKSIPRKNIKMLAGRPLVHWTMQAALDCPQVDQLFVASEDEEIRETAASFAAKKLEVIDRDPRTATDEASTESALLQFAREHDFKRVVLIQATSPLLTSKDLTSALAHLDSTGADSLLSVTREHRFIWRRNQNEGVSAANYDPLKRPRRQDWNGELFENGAFYITSKEALLKSECRVSGRTEVWEMSSENSLELDEPRDWSICEELLIYRRRSCDLADKCRNIQLLITDVDGVLTDAGMYYSDEGDLLKKFNTRDGMGLGLWRKAGLETVIMTSEDSEIVSKRAEKLGIRRVFLGVKNKKRAVEELLEAEGLLPGQVAFIGDDLNDLKALAIVGLAACPADAIKAIRANAHYVCERRGGEGCVRELIDLILDFRQ